MYKYFKLEEFDSPDEPGSGEMMEPAVIEALENARDLAGFPFVVTSGVRSIAVSYTHLTLPTILLV